jgi:hypothetical protein
LLNADEAADFYRVSTRQLYYMVAKGHVPRGLMIPGLSNPRWDVRTLNRHISALSDAQSRAILAGQRAAAGLPPFPEKTTGPQPLKRRGRRPVESEPSTPPLPTQEPPSAAA